MTGQDDNSIRKAAVLLRSLDAESAAVVLQRLSADEASRLRAAIRDLGDVTEDERRDVADAMRRPAVSPAPAQPAHDGVELELSTKLVEEAATPIMANAPPAEPPAEEPLAALHDLAAADGASLIAYLERELPQTVAVVLSCLPPDQAAAALGALPAGRQTEVLDRFAELGDADDVALQTITADLRRWIADQQRRRKRRDERLDALEAILAAATPEVRAQLLGSRSNHPWRQRLAAEAPPVAEELVAEPEGPAPAERVRSQPVPIEPPPLLVTFAQVEKLPASALAYVLRHAPAEHLLLALAGGTEQLVARISKMLPRRQAAQLRQRLATLGPTRLKDVERAQESVARVASDLMRRGRVALPARTH